MRFLVTNDDGISSPGLATIVEVLKQFGQVFVVCPNQDKSAVSHSITFQKPLKVLETFVFGEEVKAWTVNGTPADCVKIALEVLVPNKIDFVISGMNIGANIGRDSYYSGTIGGAREASFYGLPAVAVSLDVVDVNTADFSVPKTLFKNMMGTLLSNKLSPSLLLNINIPYIPERRYKGIKYAKLDLGIQRYKHEEVLDASGLIFYWLKKQPEQRLSNHPIGDFSLLREGYITVTPLEVDLTDQYYKREIEHWFEDKPVPYVGSLI